MNKILATVVLVCMCSVFVKCLQEFSELLDTNHHEDKLSGVTNDLMRKFAVACIGINSFINEKWMTTVDLSRINMLMYESDNFHAYKIKNAPRLILDSPNFNASKPVVIFVHGWNNKPDEPIIKLMARNYIKTTPVNFLSYDINKYISGDYFLSVRAVPILGNVLFKFLTYLHRRGIPGENIHLIGFSLGAQISAIASRKFKAMHNSSIYRITALDPAGPCFTIKKSRPITKNDASYVDVIHTSLISVSDDNIGHADFYVNGKSGTQPGCLQFDILCSHIRSMSLYTASIIHKNSFVAKKCNGINNARFICAKNGESYFGYGSKSDTRGTYYLSTSDEYPYVSKQNGIR